MIPVVLVLTPGDRRGAILAGQPLRLPGPGPCLRPAGLFISLLAVRECWWRWGGHGGAGACEGDDGRGQDNLGEGGGRGGRVGLLVYS